MIIDSDVENKAKELAKWLKTQPHLPDQMDHLLLARYVHSVYGNMEKAKNLINLSLNFRTKNSHIFFERDPLSPAAQQVFEVTDMIPLPNLTQDNCQVLMYRLADHDPAKYDFVESIKVFFMTADMRLITPDGNGGISDGEIPIFDMAGCKMKHLTKIVLSVLRIYMKYTQECHPVRLRNIHVINCSSFIDRIVAIMKPFMRAEVFRLMRFHLPDSDTLEEYVPKEFLPNEYGGKAGTIAEIKGKWRKSIEDNRQYLMDERNWMVKDVKKDKFSAVEQVGGNFGKLSID